MTDDLIITAEHLHTAPSWTSRPGFCNRTARVWAKRHGFDWSEFVFHGIPASKLEATGDAFALRVVEHARNQEKTRGQQ